MVMQGQGQRSSPNLSPKLMCPPMQVVKYILFHGIQPNRGQPTDPFVQGQPQPRNYVQTIPSAEQWAHLSWFLFHFGGGFVA